MNYRRISKIFGLTLATMIQACSASSSAISNPVSSNPPSPQANSQANAPINTQSQTANPPAAIATEIDADTKQNKTNLPQSCAIDSYTEFFENFVRGQDYSGNEMRYRFTAAYVQVRDYQNPSRLIEVMSRKNDEFSISLRDYRWVQLVPSNGSPYTRLKLEIKKIGKRMFRVDYIKAEFAYTGGESEGESLVRTEGAPNAYIFEHRNGCWYLTQKLQSQLSPSNNESNNRTNVSAISSQQAQKKIEANLVQQMPYADLRSQLIANNWFPITDQACKENTGGTAKICEEIPELESCSGDGYCLMNFGHRNGNKLSITTYGNYQDWNVQGQRSRLRITQWSFSRS